MSTPNIEKGGMNPSFEILLAISRVLLISFDKLITPEMDKAEAELRELTQIYLSCPEPVRKTLMESTRTLVKHLTEFSIFGNTAVFQIDLKTGVIQSIRHF